MPAIGPGMNPITARVALVAVWIAACLVANAAAQDPSSQPVWLRTFNTGQNPSTTAPAQRDPASRGLEAAGGSIRLIPATQPREGLVPPSAAATQPATAPATTGAAQSGASIPLEAAEWLRVTGDQVNLRGDPDLSSPVTAQVGRDTVLRFAGLEGEWCRVFPPSGSFSLVSAQYVARSGVDRGVVRVSSGTLRVRMGSTTETVDPMRSKVQANLSDGDEVRILGEQDGWLRIVPPDGVFYYVSREYVQPVSAEEARRLQPAETQALTQLASGAAAPASAAEASEVASAAVATRPSGSQPIGSLSYETFWGRRLKAVLDEIEVERQRPINLQSWTGLHRPLEILSQQTDEPAVAQAAAAALVQLDGYMSVHRMAMTQASASQPSAPAAPRRPAGEYDAVGVLRMSLRVPVSSEHGLRYELQDPYTRAVRAVIEVPTRVGADAPRHIGAYVGVRGVKHKIEELDVELITVDEFVVLELPPRTGTRPTP